MKTDEWGAGFSWGLGVGLVIMFIMATFVINGRDNDYLQLEKAIRVSQAVSLPTLKKEAQRYHVTEWKDKTDLSLKLLKEGES